MSDEDNFLKCPRCGSLYLVSSRRSPRSVFHIEAGIPPSIVYIDGPSGDDDTVDRERLYCGACSWAGTVDELL